MERHIQIFLNKLSFVSIAIATVTLFFLFLQTPETCVDPTSSSTHPKPHHKFPKSTCEISHRSFTSLEKRNHRLWSTKTWSNTVSSYSSIFLSLQTFNFLSNHSKTLVLSAGPGHAVMSLNQLGVADVTGVELIDSPPLVCERDGEDRKGWRGLCCGCAGVWGWRGEGNCQVVSKI
ncbi:unnamed protein product [Ilex paraguariensis]|uniref:Uncharacterized protein n=1 Tax=Ilex paraguariensis TaxID=185542 RepID=A0ABC8V549_9AQUA